MRSARCLISPPDIMPDTSNLLKRIDRCFSQSPTKEVADQWLSSIREEWMFLTKAFFKFTRCGAVVRSADEMSQFLAVCRSGGRTRAAHTCGRPCS